VRQGKLRSAAHKCEALARASYCSRAFVCCAHSPLPQVHDEIVQKCFNNQLMIIHGATGCGKTTQIPQFILKELRRVKVRGNILCCQPRRLATMSVADRVKEELGGDSIVGYTIRGLSTVRSNTEITFCTTGIVNAMLKEDPDLQDVNFIIVDEVHERSVHVDLLLTHLRGLIARGARKVSAQAALTTRCETTRSKLHSTLASASSHSLALLAGLADRSDECDD